MRVIGATVPPGEGSKTLAQVERLSRLAAEAGLRRADAVVGAGGGMVGDLAGFVAASYQRGVRLFHLPTTLLAMVDSSIGGKTGVDLPEGKNYVGAIWQPDLVLMDTDVLDGLPPRELACGFAEVIKYGLLEGGELLELIESWPALPGPADELSALIRRCVAHKLAVVASDERDHGVRASLNLGHTGRARDRGGRRLRALPPRRGHLARPARGPAPVGGGARARPGGARPARPPSSSGTVCRRASMPRWRRPPSWRRSAATRRPTGRRSTWCCSPRPATSGCA